MAKLKRTMGCGCIVAVDYNETNEMIIIVYCSKHKAALEMYEACLTALGVMATLDQSKGWVKEISGVIQKALAKAEL